MKNPIAIREEEILKFWQKENIFEKSVEKNNPKGDLVFFDGPPFATGLPHYGHMLAGTIKDIIPRYKTMQGFRVKRRWGWDCHGLPVENLIEKELGLKTKKDIEEYGVLKFNEAARASVLRFRESWMEVVPRVGRFIDMENDYVTMDPLYTESVWWSWKTLYDKKLAYESYKIMPYCPRCGTTVSNFEVNQGYKDITDISVYVKFKVLENPTGNIIFNDDEIKKAHLIAWTTTPWTLPGNTALAIKSDVLYVKAESAGEYFIVAKDLVNKVLGGLKDGFKVVDEFTGSKLSGIKYEPVFDYFKDEKKLPNVSEVSRNKMWRVYTADFVTTTDGTGIVHIAPGFGSDDYDLSVREGVPMIIHVDEDGSFSKNVTDFSGLKVKPKSEVGEKDGHQKTDIEIIKKLAHSGSLLTKEKIIHSYPHCWRCETPLINYASSSWFVSVTSIKKDLIKNNAGIKWVPKEVGEGRFANWLEGARDWAVSRTRYWGAPLPIWKSEDGSEIEVLGSIADIKNKTRRNTYTVMRHGEAEHNVKNIVSGKADNPHHLTDKGKAEVIKKTKELKKKNFDLIFSSPLVRTLETAGLVKEGVNFSGEIIVDKRLREFDFGDYDGKSVDEYHAYYSSVEEKFTKRLPNGECMNDVKNRVGEFIYDIDSKYQGKNILIVTHNSPATLIQSIAKGESAKQIIRDWKKENGIMGTANTESFDFAYIPHNLNYELDLHRPYIDEVTWISSKGNKMKRISHVFDTWYDSGSMPFAKAHYPFENEKSFIKSGEYFPADFIAEGLDQTRGWFYTLLVLGTALFNTSPYKNVVVNGLILAEDGRKMSKSLKNYPEIMPTLDKYGADALRYFLISSPAVRGEEVRFSEKGLDEVLKKHIQRLLNVYTFYEMNRPSKDFPQLVSNNVLDEWIISRLSEIHETVTKNLEIYELDRAIRPIAEMIDDLSTWYIRRSRDRFKSEDTEDTRFALSTTHYVLNEFSKILAPFMPFLAEDIYQKLRGNKGLDLSLVQDKNNGVESVHLENWTKKIPCNKKVLAEMKIVREICSRGLELRMTAQIKVRQPLKALKISKDYTSDGKMAKDLNRNLLDIIKDEINVKEIVFESGLNEICELDTNITPELKDEGIARDLIRAIQDKRKEGGFSQKDRVKALIPHNSDHERVLRNADLRIEIETVASLSSLSFYDGAEILIDSAKNNA